MTDIILVLLVELVILHRTERPSPERNGLVYRQAKYLSPSSSAKHTPHVNPTPLTFKKSPYCRRPWCFRCLSRLKLSCRWRMHIGKCFRAIPSIMSAVTSSPTASDAEAHSDEMPAKKPCERLSSRGTIRVSSSSRGRCLSVNYREFQ